jgi:hypothetical protein
MSNLPAVLKAELASLQRELERDPRFRRMRKIADLLADYEPPLSPPPASAPTVHHLTAAPIIGSKERSTSKAAKIRREIKALMEQHGIVSRRRILEHLLAKGILGKEQRPLKTVGTYLYKGRDIWANDGKGNWFLKPTAPPIPSG